MQNRYAVKFFCVLTIIFAAAGSLFAEDAVIDPAVEKDLPQQKTICPDAMIKVVIKTDDWGSETTWEVIDEATGNLIDSGGPYSDGASNTYTTEICVDSDKCYTFIIYDEYDDGMCCEYGNGSYRVYYNGVLEGSGGAFGAYEIVTIGSGCGGASVPHDECVDAIAVTEGIPYPGSTIGATGTDISSCTDGDSNDVWHSFTPEKSAEYTVSLCGSSFDTSLAVYANCFGSELACNDDHCDYQSQLKIELNAGQEYFIRIAGYDGGIGSYTLEITENVCIPPDPADQPLPYDGAVEVDTQTNLAWNGQVLPMAPKTLDKISKLIYGSDDRLDQYQVTDPVVLAVGDATVAIMSGWMLSNNGDGTYDLPTETFAQYYLSEYGRPLCSDERFRNQPNPAWCSGFLVAPDIVATAGHCITGSGDCSDAAFIFGFVMENATTAAVTIDASQIYYCSEIIERVETDAGPDWSLVRLDRPVPDHQPLAVRRSGKVADGANLMIIGHPMGLPRKYASNAIVRDNSDSSYFQANLDSYGGNSGSVVIDYDTLLVEGTLVRGNEDFVQDGACDRSNVCPDSGCPYWEDVTRATEFSQHLPSSDVYLSDDPGQLVLVASDVVSNTCDPGTLLCGTTYYWQVVSKGCADTSSPIFSFTTAPAGDLNADCEVNLSDFAKFSNDWQSINCELANGYCNGADIDKNGTVELADLASFAHNWLTVHP